MNFNTDWENVWASFALAVAITGVTLLGNFVFHKKVISGYYLETGIAGVTCVKQSIDWDADGTAFCSDDVDKTLRVLKALQEKK